MLAVFLLIPIVMKFQVQSVLESSVPQTSQEVLALLQKEGVVEPWVSLDYFEATIGGFVTSQQEAEAVVAKIEGIRGVGSVVTELTVSGELKISRQGGRFFAEGLVPASWQELVLAEQADLDVSALKSKESIVFPGANPAGWGLLMDYLFQSSGERQLWLRGQGVVLSGEATPKLKEKINFYLARLGGELEAEFEWEVFPSRYHYPSRIIQSPVEGEPLRSIQRQLREDVFQFEGQELSRERQSALADLAATMVAHKKVRFVLGGYPAEDFTNLGKARALEIKRRLVSQGVSAERLQVVPFEMTEDRRGLAGQVELLVL